MSKDTGGQAFPTPIAGCDDGRVYNAIEQNPLNGGMTLRDYFAAQALPAMIEMAYAGNAQTKDGKNITEATLSAQAYCFADAMIAERAK